MPATVIPRLRVEAVVAWSKFNPDAEPTPPDEATSPSALRRIRILRWVNWIVLVYTALGFGFIAYWLLRG